MSSVGWAVIESIIVIDSVLELNLSSFLTMEANTYIDAELTQIYM